MPEEKEETVASEATPEPVTLEPEATEDDPSDFADEVKPVTPPVEEAKPAEPEAPKEPEINWYLEKDETPSSDAVTPSEAPATDAEPVTAEEASEPIPQEASLEPSVPPKEEPKSKGKKRKPAPIVYQYDDPHLAAMEDARKECAAKVKKLNIWRGVVTGVCLAIVILAWVLMTIPEISNALASLGENASMIVVLIVAGIGLIGLMVANHVLKKKTDAIMKVYFDAFFLHQTAYIYPSDCANLKGSVDTKLDPDKFKECGIYKDISQVGSRACYTFSYHDVDVTVADASGQSQEKKALRTAFVGKYVYFPNNYVGEDILIYFKGNKRALPPTNLAGRSLFQDSKNMVIYGPATTRRVLKAAVKNALAAFETNATFVDLAISIREGTTYLAVGFEDDLMIMPLVDAFNPKPTIEAKKVMNQVLALIDALNSKN